MIQEREDEFDLVMADTNMTEMDIFTFLQRILFRSDMPVIFMSSEEDVDMVSKALRAGACFFLQKPICRRDIINVWQHVYRKRIISQKIERRNAAVGIIGKGPRGKKIILVDSWCKNVQRNNFLGMDNENMSTDSGGKIRKEVEGGFRQFWGNEDGQSPRKARIEGMEKENQGVSCSLKRGSSDSYSGRGSDSKSLESIDNSSEGKDFDDSSSSNPEKRSRMKWTRSLHLKFMDVISSMGDGKVHPRTVLRRMNEPSLSVRHIASHLQKYRDRVNTINSSTGTPVFQHNMPATPYNFNAANGGIAGMLDKDNPTMQTHGFGTGASSVGPKQDPSPPGYCVPLYQKKGTLENADTSVHYTLKTLLNALESANLTEQRSSFSSANNMFDAPVQAASNGEPIYKSNGLSATAPNGTNLISNADQLYDHENQQLLGFDWSTQNFSHLSPQPDLNDLTGIYTSFNMLPDVPEQLLGPLDQDLNPPPQYNLQNPDQLPAQGTSYLEGQSSNSSIIPNSSSFASDLELNLPNSLSFSDLLNIFEGDQGEVNRELNCEPEIGEGCFLPGP